MEKLIKRWWFYLILVFLIFVPSIGETPISPEETSIVVQEVLQRPLIYRIPALFPVAKLVLLFSFIGALIWKNRFRRAFAVIFSILSILITIFQNISVETRYGYAILLGNILAMGVVVLAWFYEIRVCKNDFSSPKLRWWNILLLMFSFLAFWMPARYGEMCFSLKDLFMNEAGLTYCMVTPVVLSFLLLYYPKVNKALLRITSFIGLLYGLSNTVTWFALNTEFMWMGVIHLPLLVISAVGLILSKRFGDSPAR